MKIEAKSTGKAGLGIACGGGADYVLHIYLRVSEGLPWSSGCLPDWSGQAVPRNDVLAGFYLRLHLQLLLPMPVPKRSIFTRGTRGTL